MANYRKISWQRNIRLIPTEVTAKLQRLPSATDIALVCTKRVSAHDLKAGAFHHLQIKLGDRGDPTFPAKILPAGDVGPYSFKNCNGWEVKRNDLPMISKKIYLGERPNFGDWSKGSFSLWQERMVYQVEEYSPTDYSIEIDLLQSRENSFVFKFALDCVLDRNNSNFNEDLLFCLNVLQENTGSCDVDRSGRKREEYIATTLVDWEIFPPGSLEHFLARAKSAFGKSDAESRQVIEERVEEFRRLSPERFILGKGGFNRYIGAVLSNNVVVFENIRYGNALYVLYENWEDVSQRSRIDLIKGTSAAYERIPHVDGWEERFREAVKRRPSHRRS